MFIQKPTYWQRLKIAFQYVMPQVYMTRIAGWFADKEWGTVTHFVIKAFANKYRINMSEAEYSDFKAYSSFNQFFTRGLKEGVRPIVEGEDKICFPADGSISQFGEIQDGTLLQAKGHSFQLIDLLAGDAQLTQEFANGKFVTTYLSPKDYHRVHMPCNATLRKMVYVPGELFSVNPFLAEHIPNLFARNERVICIFDTEFGTMVQILVGATITASIRTTWAGIINPPRYNHVVEWFYSDQDIKFTKGQEMGAFQLGSTVINIFPAQAVKLKDLQLNRAVKMGEIMASIKA